MIFIIEAICPDGKYNRFTALPSHGMRHTEADGIALYRGPRKVARLFGERRSSGMSELFVLTRKRTIWSLRRRVAQFSKQGLRVPHRPVTADFFG